MAVLKDVDLSDTELSFCSVCCVVKEKFGSQKWNYAVRRCRWVFVNMLGIADGATFEYRPVGKLGTSPSLVQTPSQICFMAFRCCVFEE